MVQELKTAIAEDDGAPIAPSQAHALFWIHCLSFEFYSSTPWRGRQLPDRFVYQRNEEGTWAPPFRVEA